MPVFSRIWTNPQTGASDPDRLQRIGPALNVEITIPKRLAVLYSQRGVKIPQPETGIALIDTGASITAVDSQALGRLGLQPVGVVNVRTPQGQTRQGLYPCQISFPGTPIDTLQFNAVTGSQLEHQGYKVLIGRDLLRYFQLVYNGIDGFWTLAF